MLLDKGPSAAVEATEPAVLHFNWSASEHWIPLALTAVAFFTWLLATRSNKFWAALIGLNAATVAGYTAWCAYNQLWLPETANDLGAEVDGLFNLVLFLTSIFYFITQAVLIYTMVQKPPANGRAKPVHGNHTLEIAWMLVPAFFLAVIAIAQLPTWAKMKGQTSDSSIPVGYDPATDSSDLLVTVTGKQWEWRMRYADPAKAKPTNPLLWASTPAADDMHVVNELHAWQGAKVRLMLRTTDVIHSFFMPQFRFKQDMLPGKTIPALLRTDKTNINSDGTERCWEIACAELCGGNHYRMRGKVVVHATREDFMRWLSETKTKQTARKDFLAAATKPSDTPAGKE